MDHTALTWGVFLSCSYILVFVQALVVSRGTVDVFSKPMRQNCKNNETYCTERQATCLGANCCSCKCKKDYSTFHSPGVTYHFRGENSEYRFDGDESCAWNHYAHEGCRFIEEHASTSGNRFLPLINLNKTGNLHLKALLEGIFQCNRFQLFSKRPFEHAWVDFKGENIFKLIKWDETKDISLTLQWHNQGEKFAGLLLKLDFSCEPIRRNKKPKSCIILKIKGSYDTETNASRVATSTLSDRGQELKSTTQATPDTTTSPVLVPSQGSQKPTDTMNKTETPNQAANTDKIDERGDTFWILVYVFMAFAIFEVICVALFLIYRQRKRKRKQRKSDLVEGNAEHQGPTTYDNHAMTAMSASTINLPAENIQLYENEAYHEPRYSVVKRLERPQRNEQPTLMENGIVANTVPSESSSRRTSRAPRSRSIIVLPKDCVIVHASGSQSRRSRHSEQDGEHNTNNERENGTNKVNHNADDNKSLYSWESFSTFYRTSTDEDYASGSNPAPEEEDSLYEEPDKILPKENNNKPPALPAKNFSLDRLLFLQESVITAANNDGDNNGNDDNNGDSDGHHNDHDNEEDEDEEEHIYESAESVILRNCVSYYENAYDLPEDALANGPDKPNKGSLKHILHETSEGDSKPSLNLGVEFVNNDEDDVNDDDDVRLRPQRKSMLFLEQLSETKDNTTSVC